MIRFIVSAIALAGVRFLDKSGAVQDRVAEVDLTMLDSFALLL
jgi:hypothetical protein